MYSKGEVDEIEEFDFWKNAEKLNHTKLLYQESIQLEGDISYSEAGKTLLFMANDKSPGSDGFTVNYLNFSESNLENLLLDL